tara:strand:- start:1181 stop:1468 length:288 start_codon:yes stop_codon:yes gene_type:complete
MLDILCDQTNRIKFQLIKYGIEMPPPISMHSSKLKQIDNEYKQMTTALHMPLRESVFKNAQQVFLTCSGKYYSILNITDLFKASTITLNYMQNYE